MSAFTKIIICDFSQRQWFSKTRKKCEIIKEVQRAIQNGWYCQIVCLFLGSDTLACS